MMKKLITLFLMTFLVVNVHSAEIELTDRERACLTSALYHEARGETDKGMFEVASVILNRTEHPQFPPDVCSVIYQRGQFTFDKKAPMREQGALDKVKSIVEAVTSGFRPLSEYIFFHRYDVKGMCSNKKHKKRISDHVFCK